MTKYRVIAEKRVHYNIEVIKKGTFWQYQISSKDDPLIRCAYGMLSEDIALKNAKEAIIDLDEVDYLRYSWKVDDEA